jgi:hypothetical protein
MMEDIKAFLSLGGIDARAQFVARFFGMTAVTSTTFGLVAGNFGAFLPCGPLLPFLCGSVSGYLVGVCGFWRAEKMRALEYADMYPNIMEHVLATEFSHVAERIGLLQSGRAPMGEWVRTGGTGRMSWAILAAQSCKCSVQQLHEDRLQKLIDAYKEAPPGPGPFRT